MKPSEQGPGSDSWTQKRAEELFDEAGNAASKHDLPRLTNAHQKLTSFYALLRQLESIQPESLSAKPPSEHPPSANPVVAPPKSGESDKERGERERISWVSANLPSTLTPLRGALYRKPSGDILGIAYGEEKEGREGRWFLGLPAGKFHSAVLLCRPLAGNLFWLALPKDFISNHNSRLSKSKVGQVKFSVFKRGENYYLRVPTTGTVSVTEYLNTLP